MATHLTRLKIHSSFGFKAFQSNISKSRVSSQKIGMQVVDSQDGWLDKAFVNYFAGAPGSSLA